MAAFAAKMSVGSALFDAKSKQYVLILHETVTRAHLKHAMSNDSSVVCRPVRQGRAPLPYFLEASV